LLGASATAAVLFSLVASSDSFQACEHERKNHRSYAALHKEIGLPIHATVRLKLALACTRVTLGENDGPIVALATIALGIFTCTLWLVTRDMAKAADRQRVDFIKSVNAAEKAADAAKFSADAVILTERAYILVHKIQTSGLALNYGVPVERYADVYFYNFGRTPGRILYYRAFCRILDHIPNEGDETVASVGGGDVFRGTEIVPADQPYFPGRARSPDNEMRFYDDKGHFVAPFALYVWGTLRYSAILGSEGVTRFKRRLGRNLEWETVGPFEDNACE
jgi:hypothetical protein